MLGKIEGRRRRGWQRMRWLYGITDSMDMSLSYIWELWWTGRHGELQSMRSQRVRHDWTEVNQCSGFEKLSGSCLSFGWRKGSIEKGIKDQPYRYIKKQYSFQKEVALQYSAVFSLFCFVFNKKDKQQRRKQISPYLLFRNQTTIAYAGRLSAVFQCSSLSCFLDKIVSHVWHLADCQSFFC